MFSVPSKRKFPFETFNGKGPTAQLDAHRQNGMGFPPNMPSGFQANPYERLHPCGGDAHPHPSVLIVNFKLFYARIKYVLAF